MADDEMFSLDMAMRELGCDNRHIQNLVAKGFLRNYGTGGRYMFFPDDVGRLKGDAIPAGAHEQPHQSRIVNLGGMASGTEEIVFEDSDLEVLPLDGDAPPEELPALLRRVAEQQHQEGAAQGYPQAYQPDGVPLKLALASAGAVLVLSMGAFVAGSFWGRSFESVRADKMHRKEMDEAVRRAHDYWRKRVGTVPINGKNWRICIDIDKYADMTDSSYTAESPADYVKIASKMDESGLGSAVISAIAGNVTNGAASSAEKARRIFGYISSNVVTEPREGVRVKNPVHTLVSGVGDRRDIAVLSEAMLGSAGLETAFFYFPKGGDNLESLEAGVAADLSIGTENTVYCDAHGKRYFIFSPAFSVLEAGQMPGMVEGRKAHVYTIPKSPMPSVKTDI